MSESVYYMQPCPTCGRNLRIRIMYLGRQVICQHCQAQFVACEPGRNEPPPHDSGPDLLRRADELLELANFFSSSRPK